MTPNEYLTAILKQQDIEQHPDDLKTLNDRRTAIVTLLKSKFTESKPTVKIGGSLAKGTAVWEDYDLDVICYFPNDNSEADTIKELFQAVSDVVSEEYFVTTKTSALRLKSKPDPGEVPEDFHIDVVPGRYTDDSKAEAYLHQTSGEKRWLKTNPQVHIDHVKDSGVTEAIRLLKLWRTRHNLDVKTFVLELLAITLLAKYKKHSIESQITHVWEEFRDHSDLLAVEDPANSGNDLSGFLDATVRANLSSTALFTLQLIATSGWESVFGKATESDDSQKTAKYEVAAASVTKPTKPYCG